MARLRKLPENLSTLFALSRRFEYESVPSSEMQEVPPPRSAAGATPSVRRSVAGVSKVTAAAARGSVASPGPRSAAAAAPAMGSAGALATPQHPATEEETPGGFDGWEQDKDDADDGWGDDGGWGDEDGWDDVPVSGSPPTRGDLTTPNTV